MFQVRNSRPNGSPFYITKGAGGYSTCIVGSPTASGANVLANCVGYACGRFNEIIGSMKYPALNCNAENFIERAISLGLSISKEPVAGGIMVWQKGATLGGSDGAGHVAIVERKNSNDQIYCSESGYGGSAFWNSTRNRGNGNWGSGSGYTYRGCIVNPSVKDEPAPAPTPEPTPSEAFNVGDKVVINGNLYASSNAGSPAGSTGDRVTNITRKNPGSAHPYNTTGDLGWMNESSIRKYVEPTPTPEPQPEPTPQPVGLQVGDAVKIIKHGNGSAYGSAGTAGGIGWTRYITKIYEGKPFPYQVGNRGLTDGGNTTGFYTADALQKI